MKEKLLAISCQPEGKMRARPKCVRRTTNPRSEAVHVPVRLRVLRASVVKSARLQSCLLRTRSMNRKTQKSPTNAVDQFRRTSAIPEPPRSAARQNQGLLQLLCGTPIPDAKRKTPRRRLSHLWPIAGGKIDAARSIQRLFSNPPRPTIHSCHPQVIHFSPRSMTGG
jgi:hypothetical protein